MNIEKTAKKLQPLMPYKVSQWIRAMELAELDLRTLIEKQIISTAYQTLGDLHNKILGRESGAFSICPKARAMGQVNPCNSSKRDSPDGRPNQTTKKPTRRTISSFTPHRVLC